MKSVRNRLLVWWNSFLGVVIAALGISCKPHKIHQEEEILCKYGIPNASFHVDGNVKNSNKMPVSRARVIVEKDNNPNDTVYTDENGDFISESGYFPTKKVVVTVQDAEGEYMPYIDEQEIQYEGGTDGWNQGVGKAHFDIVLQKGAIMVKYGLPPIELQEKKDR